MLWIKSWNDGKCIFHKRDKKIIKHFAKKSFSVFGGAHGRPLNTLKLFSAKCFIIFFSRLWKIHLLSFQDFLHKNLLVSSSNVIFHYNTVKIEYNDGLFLDVNEKRPFLDIKRIPKATKLKKCSPKKFSWVIWLYKYWFYLFLKIICE